MTGREGMDILIEHHHYWFKDAIIVLGHVDRKGRRQRRKRGRGERRREERSKNEGRKKESEKKRIEGWEGLGMDG